jgi:hypothetical protein
MLIFWQGKGNSLEKPDITPKNQQVACEFSLRPIQRALFVLNTPAKLSLAGYDI